MSETYTAHAAKAANLAETVCGEPWQGWQAPLDREGTMLDDLLIGGTPLSPYDKPKYGQNIRQCQACFHRMRGGNR